MVIGEQWGALPAETRTAAAAWFTRASPLASQLDQLQGRPDSAAARLRFLLAIEISRISHGGDDAVPLDVPWRDAVHRALADAAREYPIHRVPGLIEALMHECTRPGPALREWLADESQPGHLALRAAVKALSPAEFERLGMRLLTTRATGRTAWERWSAPESTAALASSAHFIRARRRVEHARLRGSDLPHWPSPEMMDALDEPQRLGLLACLRAVPGEAAAPDLLARLGTRLTDASPLVRAHAVLLLGSKQASRGRDALLADFAFDPDERVAALATTRLLAGPSAHRQLALMPAVRQLRRSPHRAVRRAAQSASVLIDPWSADAGAGPWSCPVAARRWCQIDPGGFRAALRERALTGPTDDRLAALELASRMRLLDSIEDVLLSGISATDERLASKAALLLGSLPGEGARRGIAEALRHPSARVRANAAEGLRARLPSVDPRGELLNADQPRLRANAIRAWIAARPADRAGPAALAAMNHDERADHRASAAWAVRRLARAGQPAARTIAEQMSRPLDPQQHELQLRMESLRRAMARLRTGEAAA